MKEGNFFLKKINVFLVFFTAQMIVGVAHAISATLPYAPGETLAPTCLPGSPNCTVKPAAAAGINTDITSLRSLSIALTAAQGGTGLSALGTSGQVLGVAADGTALEYKTINGGTGITITPGSGFLTISATGTGETNTASNIGSGTELFKQKNGTNLEFKTISPGSSRIQITSSSNQIILDADESAFHLSNLSGILSVSQGGTGATTTAGAFTALAPLQTGNAGKFLTSDGASASWGTIPSFTTTTWGTINGTLSNQTDLTSALLGKEPIIATGTATQYWRGDKTWATLDKTSVGLNNVENTALSAWGGSANITSVGTIAAGTWHGSVLGMTYGGTGLSSGGSGSQLLGMNTAGTALEYKTVVAGPNITITTSSGALTIAAASGSGEINTASNLGTGFSIFKQKSGVDLQFKTLATSSTKITITSAANTVNLDLNENALTLNNLGGNLSIAKGGTGATDPDSARTALNAAASGANNDITSLSSLSTPLSLTQGGTGMTGFTNGSLIFMDGNTGNLGENNPALRWDNDRHYFSLNAEKPNSTLHLNGSMAIVPLTITKDFTADDLENVILANASKDDVVITLPSAREVPGRVYTIKTIQVNDNHRDVTVVSESPIDGNPEIDMSTLYQSRTFIADAETDEWYIINGF